MAAQFTAAWKSATAFAVRLDVDPSYWNQATRRAGAVPELMVAPVSYAKIADLVASPERVATLVAAAAGLPHAWVIDEVDVVFVPAVRPAPRGLAAPAAESPWVRWRLQTLEARME